MSRQNLAEFKVDTLHLIATGFACPHTPQRVFDSSAPDEDAGHCKTRSTAPSPGKPGPAFHRPSDTPPHILRTARAVRQSYCHAPALDRPY